MNHKPLLTGILLAFGLLLNPSVRADAALSQDMDISQNGIDFICSLEGFSSKCYWDSSQSSIGYGTKCTGSSVQPHSSGLHSITKEDAMTAMRSGIQTNYMLKVRNQTQGLDLNQNQFDALTSLAYNCGGGLNRIYNCPLTKYLRGELSASDARNQYSNYLVYSGGKYLQGLVNRRVKEANLFFSEEFIQKPSTASISVQNNRTVFYTTEEVVFTMHSDYGTTYYLGIDYEGERLLTPKVADGNIYTHVFEQTGHYSVYVSAYNSYGFVNSSCIEFDVLEPGDINADYQVNTDDVILLQNYLQKRTGFTKYQATAADLNQDGICNIFDLIALKQKLLAQEN